VKSASILVFLSLVLLGRHVMLFHRKVLSASVHLAGRENCAKTVSDFSSVIVVILYCRNLLNLYMHLAY
jgi:hypothetical protein